MRRRIRLGWSACALGCGLMLAACGGDDDSSDGTLVVTAYGEEFVEVGIPAEEVSDGWGVTFSRFEVTLSELSVGGQSAGALSAVELTPDSGGDGQELTRLSLPTGEYDDLSFSVAGIEVAGVARRDSDGAEKRFEWSFDSVVTYFDCEEPANVPASGNGSFELTFHADHLLYDSLVAEEPQLVFGQFAEADADGDGNISQMELAAASLGALDPGSDGSVSDLWGYLQAAVAGLGHVNGEGHCEAREAQ